MKLVKANGERILHRADGPWIVGKGVRARCGKFVGKFHIARAGDTTKVCAACAREER